MAAGLNGERISPVRLATWNCCKDGATKLPVLLAESHPDIAVLPEFGSHPAVAPQGLECVLLSAGVPGERGLAVAAFGDWTISVADLTGPFPPTLLPVEVAGPRPFRLLAVWANLSPARAAHPVVEFAEAHQEWFEGPVVVAGDFNTGGVWHGLRPGLDHYTVVAALEKLGLCSGYHHDRGVEQGKEPEPTFWMYRKEDRPHHLDHVFVPVSWPIASVTVGGFDQWSQYSDHAPMVADIG